MFAVEAEGNGLFNGNVVRDGQFLDGRRLQFHTTASRPVGLGQDEFDLVAATNERIKSLAGKFGCSCKNNFHRLFP